MGMKCVYLGTAGAGAGLFQGSLWITGFGTTGIGVGFGFIQGSLLLVCHGSRTGSCPAGQGTCALLAALAFDGVAGAWRACRFGVLLSLVRCIASALPLAVATVALAARILLMK